jgi:hypothetical protein
MILTQGYRILRTGHMTNLKTCGKTIDMDGKSAAPGLTGHQVRLTQAGARAARSKAHPYVVAVPAIPFSPASFGGALV